MRTYTRSEGGGVFDVETASHVELSDIRAAILSGSQIHVRDADTGEDVTQQVLLEILRRDDQNVRNPESVERMLEGAVRLIHSSDIEYSSLATSRVSLVVVLTDLEKDAIRAWMRCMEDYGDIWQEDFGWAYFSQEYWYLLIKTIGCHWRGEPLNVQAACRAMKNGSRRTRESRLNNILAENWIVKRTDRTDHRRIWVQPTEDMLELCREHLWRSLRHLVSQSTELGILHAEETSRVLANTDAADQCNDKAFLLPWVDFLIGYTDHWNTTFHNRFPTEDYWYLFAHTLLAHWKGKPLTMRETSERMKAGTIRTRESKIHRAVAAKLIVRAKRDQDMRSTVVNITPLLENRLCAHFSTTLRHFVKLTDDLLQIVDEPLQTA